MWASWKLVFSIFFMVCGTTAESHNVEVHAYVRGKAQVSCSYPEGYESYEKYLCTKKCGNDDILVTTTRRVNRYSTHDDHQKQIFTVTISNVQLSDAGEYWCGVSRSGKDIYTAVTVHVKSDECCQSVRGIQGYEGTSVSISCPYEEKFVNSFKYMCKGSKPSTCLKQALVKTNTRQNGRFTLRELQSQFTVELTGVTPQDAGSYLCGVQNTNDFDVFSRVDLTVKEWCCVTPRNIKGILGHSVTLQCPYPAEHRSNRKFLCKGDRRNTCQTVVTSAASTDRFSVQDKPSSSSFSVTITGLRQTDAGMYWCGSDPQWTPGKYYTRLQLTLVEWCCVTPHDIKGILGHSVTLQCPYPAEHRSNRKFLCKGDRRNTCQTVVTSAASTDRFSVQDKPSSSSFSVTITGLRQTDAGMYWCGSDPQWTPGNYTRLQLTLGYMKVTTVIPTITTNTTLNKDADTVISPIILYVVPGLLLVLMVVTSVIVYKYWCLRTQGDGRNNKNSSAKEEIVVNEIYSNGRVDHHHCIDHQLQDEALYENCNSENIYGNC